MYYLELFMLLRGRGGGCGSDFYSVLKIVVSTENVALDKSVPTPLPLLRYLGT